MTVIEVGSDPDTTGCRGHEDGGSVAGKFEITKDAEGKFRFRLKAANGEIIAASESYDSKAGVKNGIASVQKSAPGAEVVDLTE